MTKSPKSAPNKEQADVTDGRSLSFRIIQALVLVVLTLQNCSLTLVTSFSRSTPGPKYLPSTAVVMAEVLKTVVVLLQLMYQNGLLGVLKVIRQDVYSYQTISFAVPAFFYTVQNNLWYYAMDNLDAMTVSVMSQLKVFTTAVFSIMLLSRQLSIVQWFALCFLVMGLTVMETDPSQLQEKTSPGNSSDANRNGFLGLLALFAACTSSGYSSVYLELIFKRASPPLDVWIANLQLQLFCLPVALLAMSSDLHKLHGLNPFIYWDRITCVVVVLNALGGFMVSLTMKYSDNITKTFAVSVSLVLNCALSWALMSVTITPQVIAGVVIVIGATWLYSAAGNRIASHKAASRGSRSPKGDYVVVKDVEETDVQTTDIMELPDVVSRSTSPSNASRCTSAPQRCSPSNQAVEFGVRLHVAEADETDVEQVESGTNPPATV